MSVTEPNIVAGPASEQWTAQSGDFDTGTNWSRDIVPGPGTRAVVSTAGGYTITSSADNTVSSLAITNSSAILDIAAGTFSIVGSKSSVEDGTIDVGDGATLSLAGVLVDNSSIAIGSTGDATTLMINGDVVLRGEGEVTFGGSGAQIVSNGSPAQLVNYTSISGDGMIGDADLKLINRGGIYAYTANAITIDAASPVVNFGTISSTGAGGLSILNSITNNASLAANGGNVTIGGALTGSGQTTIANATVEVAKGVTATQSIRFYGDGVLTLDAAQSFHGTVSTLDGTDAIDLANFSFANHPEIASVTSTTVGGASGVAVTITDRTLSVTIDLLNQFGSSYSTDPGAYRLVSDNNSADGHHPGTVFELAPPVGA